MTFYTGGSERVRIDTSGNVGIGTSSPSGKFDLTGSLGKFTIDLSGTSVSLTYGSANYLRASSAGGNLRVGGYDFVSFETGSGFSERMRIGSSGNVLIGQTTAPNGERLGVYASTGWTASITSNVATTGTSLILNSIASQQFAAYFQTSTNVTAGYIYCSGGTTSYVTTSDYRLKENVAPMTGALATVAQLKPCTYTWKADGSDGEGFIAHELQAVCPQAVTGEKDAVDEDGNPKYQGVDTSFLVATLTAAIQELKAEFDAYKLSHP